MINIIFSEKHEPESDHALEFHNVKRVYIDFKVFANHEVAYFYAIEIKRWNQKYECWDTEMSYVSVDEYDIAYIEEERYG